MTKHRLESMKGGWFVGDFDPVVLRTTECEVACKHYCAGDKEPRHVHKVATEVTLIVHGRVTMNGVEHSAGDIIRLEPGDATDFCVLEDAITLVVKLPSVRGDKYPDPLPGGRGDL